MIEVPDRPMLSRRSSDPTTATCTSRTAPADAGPSSIRNSFSKRTNQEAEDWTDIQDAIAALHASRADRARWRQRPGGALRRAGVPAVAGAQHDHRQHRRLRRRVGAQLLRVREPAAPGPALLDPVGPRSGDADRIHAGRPPAAGSSFSTTRSRPGRSSGSCWTIPCTAPRTAPTSRTCWPPCSNRRRVTATLRSEQARIARIRGGARGRAVRAEPGRHGRTVRRRAVRPHGPDRLREQPRSGRAAGPAEHALGAR